jgi:hypothetical protein
MQTYTTVAPTPLGGPVKYYNSPPVMTSVSQVTSPCLFEQKVVNGPGFWKWKKTRTDTPGVMMNKLARVEQNQSQLVPMSCLQEVVNVHKGSEVQDYKTTLPDGSIVYQRQVTPQITTYGTNRVVGPAGRPINLRMSAEDEAKMRALHSRPLADRLINAGPTINFGGQQQQQERAGGAEAAGAAEAAQSAGASQNAGRVRLPSRSALRRKQLQFTNKDLSALAIGENPNMVQANFENVNPQPGADEVAFLAYDDSYGTANKRFRMYGMTFSYRHLPYAYMTQQAYLEWLVSLSYKLRNEWPQYHRHTYDPLTDTIATMESFILVTLGRLEANDKFFKRSDMFVGAGEFAAVMHPILAAFAFRPPQRTWYSPLTARYLDGAFNALAEQDTPPGAQGFGRGAEPMNLGGEASAAGVPGIEASAITNVQLFAQSVASEMSTALNIRDSVSLDADDARVMAIVEDTTMARLARLQYIHGHVVNTLNGAFPMVSDLLNVSGKQRLFLSKEFVRYLEIFQLTDVATPFHYLTGLRMRQAAQQGLAVPAIGIGKIPCLNDKPLPIVMSMRQSPNTVITTTQYPGANAQMGPPSLAVPNAATQAAIGAPASASVSAGIPGILGLGASFVGNPIPAPPAEVFGNPIPGPPAIALNAAVGPQGNPVPGPPALRPSEIPPGAWIPGAPAILGGRNTRARGRRTPGSR